MKRARYDLTLAPETALERHVAKWLRGRAVDYQEAGTFEIAAVARDLMHGGCQSGTVGHLIYTRDCLTFFRRHKAQILRTLQDMLDDMGNTSPAELFGERWNASDHFAQEDDNQVLLAHFGFEEACRALVQRAGYDV